MTFQQFDSGAVRDSQDGKIDFALITPTFKKDLAELLTVKAKHYGDRNWEKGIPTSRSFSSLLRHVEALGRGEWLDEESGHPHTVLAAANLMFIHEFHGSEFDTLNELVGPALRNKPNLNYAEAFPTGSLEDEVINYGNPEPPAFTIWEDAEGDRWWYATDSYGSGGWSHDGVDVWKWSELDRIFFPMVRVS